MGLNRRVLLGEADECIEAFGFLPQLAVHAAGNANYRAMKQADLEHPVEAIGKKLRANMKWLASSQPAAAKPATASETPPQSEAA